MSTIQILERCLAAGFFWWILSVFSIVIGKYAKSELVTKITTALFLIITGYILFVVSILLALTVEV